MKNDDLERLPLFAWKPPVQVIPFPLHRRAGKIRDVAQKLASKTTEHHAACYASQVTQALCFQLGKVGVSPDEQERQIAVFWREVHREVALIRFTSAGNPSPKGGAA